MEPPHVGCYEDRTLESLIAVSTMSAMIRLESQHELPFPREVVWPVLSKTDWLNRSLGLPPVNYDIKPNPEGGSLVTASTRLAGLEMRWRELPFEWLEPEFYRVHRIFETGPFAEVRMGMDLLVLPEGGTRIVAYSNLTPRNAVGKWVARQLLGPRAERDMRNIIAHTEEFLRGQKKVSLPKLPVQPVNEVSLQNGLKKLRESHPEEFTLRLGEFLRELSDVEVSHIRPLAVARQWNRDEWETLSLFLHATHCGLLDLSWEILCPNCRSSRQPRVTSLSQLKRTSHCDVCQIEYDAEFDKSVELKFAVNPSIRKREEQTFCLAGPGGKPHVLSQLYLQPGEERPWKLPNLTRPLRLRSPQVKQSTTLLPEELTAQGYPQTITCDPIRFQLQRKKEGNGEAIVRIHNPNSFPVQLCLEQLAWSDDILTAARATNWQEFRDLFASEVISASEQVSIGSQVVLFTDLSGSTSMFHNLGDAAAYALVRNHFSVLTAVVRANHGTLVKTIGDAVMATFSRVDEALSAVRQMHDKLPEANPGLSEPLLLKSSLHVGPCLAVNANDRLDFFGTAINLAARMVDCCKGGDLAVSDELFRHPEAAEFLKTVSKPAEALEVRFRGFSSPHKVWRLQLISSSSQHS